jgi:hypothetical protein
MPPHRAEHLFEETNLLAYHLWQQANRPPGLDLKFWLQAEEQLFGKCNNGRSKPAVAARSVNPSAAKPAAKPAGKAVGKFASGPSGNGSVKSSSVHNKKSLRAK